MARLEDVIRARDPSAAILSDNRYTALRDLLDYHFTTARVHQNIARQLGNNGRNQRALGARKAGPPGQLTRPPAR